MKDELLEQQMYDKVAESSAAFEAMNTKLGECVAIHKERLDLANKKSKHEVDKCKQIIAERDTTIRQLEEAHSAQLERERAEKRQREQKIKYLEAAIQQLQVTPAQPANAAGHFVINGKFFSPFQSGVFMEQGERNMTLGGKMWRVKEGWIECGTVDMVGK